MKIKWDFPKAKVAANLSFDKETTRPDVEKIDSLLTTAGFDGHAVIAGHSIGRTENIIFIRKWNHFEWEEVCMAVEVSIQQHFHDVIFENSKAV